MTMSYCIRPVVWRWTIVMTSLDADRLSISVVPPCIIIIMWVVVITTIIVILYVITIIIVWSTMPDDHVNTIINDICILYT